VFVQPLPSVWFVIVTGAETQFVSLRIAVTLARIVPLLATSVGISNGVIVYGVKMKGGCWSVYTTLADANPEAVKKIVKSSNAWL